MPKGLAKEPYRVRTKWDLVRELCSHPVDNLQQVSLFAANGPCDDTLLAFFQACCYLTSVFMKRFAPYFHWYNLILSFCQYSPFFKLVLDNITAATQGPNEEGMWVQSVRFAIEGVTQGIVGILGLLGRKLTFLLQRILLLLQLQFSIPQGMSHQLWSSSAKKWT